MRRIEARSALRSIPHFVVDNVNNHKFRTYRYTTGLSLSLTGAYEYTNGDPHQVVGKLMIIAGAAVLGPKFLRLVTEDQEKRRNNQK